MPYNHTCLKCHKGFQHPAKRKKFCSQRCYHSHRTSPDVRAENFWRQINKHTLSGCWEYTGKALKSGYGNIGIGSIGSDRVQIQAHRYSWILTRGPIPEGICVLHRCDNRLCVNPSHLFLGTKKDNTADAIAKGRHHCGERNKKAKLTTEQVIEMRRLRKQGLTLRELAEQFPVTQTVVQQICAGKKWKHLLTPQPE